MNRSLSILISALILISLLAHPASAADPSSRAGQVQVSYGSLNVRSSASGSGTILTTLAKGSYVTLMSKSGSWWRVEYADGKYGYCHADYIKTVSSTASTVKVNGSLNVRSGPGTNYGRVSSLNTGDRVNILEQFTIKGTKWGCIDKGWISLDYVYIDGTTGENSGTGTVTGNDLNIRTGPGTNYDTNGSLNKGDTIKIYTQIKIDEITNLGAVKIRLRSLFAALEG